MLGWNLFSSWTWSSYLGPSIVFIGRNLPMEERQHRQWAGSPQHWPTTAVMQHVITNALIGCFTRSLTSQTIASIRSVGVHILLHMLLHMARVCFDTWCFDSQASRLSGSFLMHYFSWKNTQWTKHNLEIHVFVQNRVRVIIVRPNQSYLERGWAFVDRQPLVSC